jgi:hypothetical protein
MLGYNYDIEAILGVLPKLEEAWQEERWRQRLPYTPHRDSETIFLRRQPGDRPRDVLHQLEVVGTRHCEGVLAKAVAAIALRVEGRPGRAMLVRLAPGGRVTPHVDIGVYAEATERYHLALVTNPGAWLAWGERRCHLPAGMIGAFDKHIEHSAGNDGAEGRVHLIVDVFLDDPL